MNPAILCWEQEAKPTEYILCDVIYVKFNIKQNESMMMAKKRKRWPVKRERWPAGLEGMKGAWETVNVLALSFGLHRCKAMAPHSSTLAWKIPWMEEPGWLQSKESLRIDTTERLHFHFSLSCIGEGNGNPLQCSCLENPRDGGAWWAAVYGVTQSRTQLKWLSNSPCWIRQLKHLWFVDFFCFVCLPP